MGERSQRGIFLDPDMYKISEEDSQDEEVLSTMVGPMRMMRTSVGSGRGRGVGGAGSGKSTKSNHNKDKLLDEGEKVFQLIHEVEDLRTVDICLGFLSKCVSGGAGGGLGQKQRRGGGGVGGSGTGPGPGPGGTSLCELLLGIIPGHLSSSLSNRSNVPSHGEVSNYSSTFLSSSVSSSGRGGGGGKATTTTTTNTTTTNLGMGKPTGGSGSVGSAPGSSHFAPNSGSSFSSMDQGSHGNGNGAALSSSLFGFGGGLGKKQKSSAPVGGVGNVGMGMGGIGPNSHKLTHPPFSFGLEPGSGAPSPSPGQVTGVSGSSSSKAKGSKLFKFGSNSTSSSFNFSQSLGHGEDAKSIWDPAAMDKLGTTTATATGTGTGTGEDRLIVAGFIPDGPTIKNRHIKVGDCIENINGIPVVCSNVDLVLASILEVETQFLPQSENILSFEPRFASVIRDLKIKVHLKVRSGLFGRRDKEPIESLNYFGHPEDHDPGPGPGPGFLQNWKYSGETEAGPVTGRRLRPSHSFGEGESSGGNADAGDEDGKRVPLTSMSSICNHIPDVFLQSMAIIFISSSTSTSSASSSTNRHHRTTTSTATTTHQHKKPSPVPVPPALEDENSNVKESRIDVVFSWPNKSKSRKVEPLVSSHGMFSTLYKLLRDVTGSHPLLSRVRIDGEITDITYVSDNDGDGLLLVAIGEGALTNTNLNQGSLNTLEPGLERITSSSLCRFTKRLVKSLVFKWGSLTRAFRGTKEKEMGRFLSNATACLIDTSPEDFLFMSQPTAFPFIPKKILLNIEEILFTLEGSDFYEEMEDLPKSSQDAPCHFHCLGSILFFKGQLVVSHLKKSIQSQFYSWMMTELNKWGEDAAWTRLKRLVLWQPAFIPSPSSHGHGGSQLTEMEDAISTSSSCHYAVLVGLDYFLLGFILEPVTKCQRVKPWG